MSIGGEYLAIATKSPTAPYPVKRRPRCPPFIEINTVEDLLPYLDSVAKRPYTAGALHVTWDLQPGEKILLRADTWHDPMVIDAVKKTLEEFGCDYEVEMVERGPMPNLEGHDEIEIFLGLTKELASDMDRWVAMDREGVYDKVLWGFGGPVLAESKMKIGRMPFITPEMVATPAHTIPGEVLAAIDAWTDRTIKGAKFVRITDPEGTDISYPLPDAYFNDDHTEWNGPQAAKWWPQSPELMQKYMPGHIAGRPLFMSEKPGVDAINGVIAGTMNHIGPYPKIQMQVEDAKITRIDGGGTFGDKLRDLDRRTKDTQYPGYPGPGLMWLFEVSIGTNPKIHRPRAGYLSGWVCAIYERMRSGIIHLGFGSIITSAQEIEAARAGHPTGHWHVHLNFPTVTVTTLSGENVTVVDEGRLCALDDPLVRAVAEEFGGAEKWLEEDWIPAVPGLNCGGDYDTYAKDPTRWTQTELEICRNYHPLFMSMVNAEPRGGEGAHCH